MNYSYEINKYIISIELQNYIGILGENEIIVLSFESMQFLLSIT